MLDRKPTIDITPAFYKCMVKHECGLLQEVETELDILSKRRTNWCNCEKDWGVGS